MYGGTIHTKKSLDFELPKEPGMAFVSFHD